MPKSAIKIALYNNLGQLIRMLFDEKNVDTIEHRLVFGEELSAEIYLLKIAVNNEIRTEKIIKL